MFLDNLFFTILIIFIAIPARIMSELGFEPEKMDVIPFLIVWILFIGIIFLLIKAIFWIKQSST